jgi:crotonobetainyl-CoA:carnitine CoA-transferase CaiB-like acyl-CoA transferase
MLAGPYATMLLADLGADVIKVESPRGDFIRTAGPTFGVPGEEFGGYFHSVNRNKRSISIDLSSPKGKDVFLRLVESADVVVENFRAGVMENLGLAYETLCERNPRLVYGCIRGFGDPRTGESPYLNWPAYDIIAQAMSGFMSVNGFPDREPVKSGIGVGDLFPAALLGIGVVSAVHAARANGSGQFIDVSMYDAMLSLSERNVYQYSMTGQIPERIGNSHPIFAPFGLFQTRTGWITIAAPNDREFHVLAPLMGLPELLEDERFATAAARGRHNDEVQRVVESWTRERTTEEIVSILGGKVPVGPVQTAADIVNDPHVLKRNLLLEVPHPGTDRTVQIAGMPIKFAGREEQAPRRAPLLGENTAEILLECGFEHETIRAFIQDGTVCEKVSPVPARDANQTTSDPMLLGVGSTKEQP